MLKWEISELSMGIRILVGEIAVKHHLLRNIRSIKELAEYVFRFNKEVPGIVLPITAWLQNDLISTEYLIPLAYKQRFKHVTVIATPDTKNYTWDLGGAASFRVLFAGP